MAAVLARARRAAEREKAGGAPGRAPRRVSHARRGLGAYHARGVVHQDIKPAKRGCSWAGRGMPRRPLQDQRSTSIAA